MGSHALPDALLELVLLRLDSRLWLLRAASTCKRWRRVIASDAFLALHGAPPAVAGSYYNQGGSARPRFEPSPSLSAAAALDSRHFALDFVPGDGKCSWTVKDSRGSLLLLYREDGSKARRQDLVVCEPLTRRYVVIPPLTTPPSPSVSYWSATAVLLDAGGSEGGVGMSNFRVLCLVEDHDDGILACMFTSGGSSSWRQTSIVRPLALHLVGVAAGRRYWHDGKRNMVALDQSTLKFSSFVLPDDGIDDHVALALGRDDDEARVVARGTAGSGTHLKIFARLRRGRGGGGEKWALETTIQLSAAMLGLPRLRSFHLTCHLPVKAGTVQIRVPAPGRAARFLLDMETMVAERQLGPDVAYERKAYPSEFPWPPSLLACSWTDDNARTT